MRWLNDDCNWSFGDYRIGKVGQAHISLKQVLDYTESAQPLIAASSALK